MQPRRKLSLIKSQSINDEHSLVLKSTVVNNNIDVMRLTETWSSDVSTRSFIAATRSIRYYIKYSGDSHGGSVDSNIRISITLNKQLNYAIYLIYYASLLLLLTNHPTQMK